MATLTGGCLCGAIRYEVTGPPLHADHCHCRMCQRASGAPYAPWMTVPLSAWRLTRGAPAAYRSSPGALRSFCPACGGTLTFTLEGDGEVDVALGSLDDPAAVAVAEHIWVASAMPWQTVDPQLRVRPDHEAPPPEPAAPPGADEHLEGGCLCGAVRYRVTGLPVWSAICHCGMCRRTTGGFCSAWAIYPLDRFQRLRGKTTAYRSSDGGSRHFCPACGSYVIYMPTWDETLAEILIPTLDQAERLSPEVHAFMAEAPAAVRYVDGRMRFPGALTDGGEYREA